MWGIKYLYGSLRKTKSYLANLFLNYKNNTIIHFKKRELNNKKVMQLSVFKEGLSKKISSSDLYYPLTVFAINFE